MSNRNETKYKRIESNYDIVLVMLVILLSVFGLIMIYSVSSYNAAKYYTGTTYFFERQGWFLVAGLFAMIVVSMIDYHIYTDRAKLLFGRRPIWLLYILCIGCQIYVLFNGHSTNGSSRWITLFNIISFQPSEITKICIVILTSYRVKVLAAHNRMKSMSAFISIAIYIVPLLALVAIENLSSAIIMAGIFGGIVFIGSSDKKYFFWVVLLGIAFVAIFVFAKGYRGDRIQNWLNPENLEPGSQLQESLYAIASGGFWGKGLGESSIKLGYLEEVHTDMIFAIIVEELGIFGAILVIAVFLMLLWRILLIAVNAPDMLGGFMASGVLIQVALQFIMHIAVVTNSMPATGVSLPFISYGGSSLMVLMAEMGVVLSVSKFTDKDELPQVARNE